MKSKCECGCGNETELVLQDGDIKYIICHNCILGLVNVSLAPVQFFSLIKNGHSDTEFYLHDDFYDEEGRALQPHGEVL